MDNYLSQVYTTVRDILKSHTHELNYFEDTLRSTIASTDIESLLKGNVPIKNIFSSFKHALRTTSEKMESETLSLMLWNPILATTLDTLEQSVISVNHESDRSTKPRTSRDSVLDVKSNLKCVKPVSKTITVEHSLDTIYLDLDRYLARNKAPYKSTKHIQCSRIGCLFCKGMFNGISLTKCESHKPCTPSGWFPHVGRPLWNSLKKKHDPERHFVNSPRILKADEKPNRAKSLDKLPMVKSAPLAETGGHVDWATEMDNMDLASPKSRQSELYEPTSPLNPPHTASRNPLARYRVSDEEEEAMYNCTSLKRLRSATPP